MPDYSVTVASKLLEKFIKRHAAYYNFHVKYEGGTNWSVEGDYYVDADRMGGWVETRNIMSDLNRLEAEWLKDRLVAQYEARKAKV